MAMPTVCAVMLTRDRPELAARAVECFRKQTYEGRYLHVLDSGENPINDWLHAELGSAARAPKDIGGVSYSSSVLRGTIGSLRNLANTRVSAWVYPDIFLHWDDDDYSHPNRIAEQVAFLQETGAQAVGYNDMLFSRTENLFRPAIGGGFETKGESQAWLFSYSQAWRNKVLGTSLCYWRKTWEAKPFPDEPKNRESSGEDTLWMQGLDVRGCSSLTGERPLRRDVGEPMMIARIHGANFGAYDIEKNIEGGSQEWKRVPEWDNHVREILK